MNDYEIMIRKIFIFIFITLSIVISAKETICLNMIVKNESHVIRRSLDSVKGLIDYWVIVDTGSTDGTQDIIREHMKDIPGEVFERPWKNFAHNRTEALELAKATSNCSYILILDADDWFAYDPGFQWPVLDKDAYDMWWIHRPPYQASYLKTQMIKASLPWRWESVLHEYLTCGQPITTAELKGIKYMYGADGARTKDPDKYKKDVQVLENALKDEPENPRYVFYLAESYCNAGELEKAIAAYHKRSTMNDWEEEVFYSLFQIANLQTRLNKDVETCINSYQLAHRRRPHRAEPVYHLAEIYNKQGNFALAYECLCGYQAMPKPKTRDLLFNWDWVEEYGLLFQFSICAYYVGEDVKSLEACEKLLTIETLPDSWKKLVEENKKFPQKRICERRFAHFLGRNISQSIGKHLKESQKALPRLQLNTSL